MVSTILRRNVPIFRTRENFSLGLIFLTMIGLLIVYKTFGYESKFPDFFRVDMAAPVNLWADWFSETFRFIFRPISKFVQSTLKGLDKFVVSLPWMWVVLVVGTLTWKVGGVRLALFACITLVFNGMISLWDEGLITLNIMIISVAVTIAMGLPIGIFMALNNRAEKIMRPILDAMQTMPIFVYLIPVMLLFGIGSTSALFATIIYSIPPVIRLTNLGIRQVSAELQEVGMSFGSTRSQMLLKLQLPLARESIMAGINQTVMMALGMVIFVALLGGSGLGKEIWYAMRRLQVGRSVEVGIAVVFLAIYLDRLSLSFTAEREKDNNSFVNSGSRIGKLLARSGLLTCSKIISAVVEKSISTPSEFIGRGMLYLSGKLGHSNRDAIFRNHINGYSRILFGILFLLLAYFLILWSGTDHSFPKALSLEFSQYVDTTVRWMTVNLNHITSAIRTGMYLVLIIPIRSTLFWLPWPILIGAIGLLAMYIAGWRIALLVVSGFSFIGIAGMWDATMLTMSQVIVAIIFSILFAIPIGVLTAKNKRADAIIRPILDTMQTLPAFVYFPVVIFLFRVGELSGIIATIIYALPPAARMTSLGLKMVPEQVLEPARSLGSTNWQMLYKIQFPLALPSIMAGVNQTTMLALAMVVYGALIGAQGLGNEVMIAIGKFDVGRGFESGMSIVLIAVIFDRITQAWAENRKKIVT
jgi:glycine betaine/proline transport system permease protein